jgi:type IV pilus assembly protein PilB
MISCSVGLPMTSVAPILPGLLKCLVKQGLLTEQLAQSCVDESSRKGVPSVSHLVASGLLSSRTIAERISLDFGVPLLDLTAFVLDGNLIGIVSEKLVQKHHVLPLLQRGNRLFLAVADPTTHRHSA